MGRAREERERVTESYKEEVGKQEVEEVSLTEGVMGSS